MLETESRYRFNYVSCMKTTCDSQLQYWADRIHHFPAYPIWRQTKLEIQEVGLLVLSGAMEVANPRRSACTGWEWDTSHVLRGEWSSAAGCRHAAIVTGRSPDFHGVGLWVAVDAGQRKLENRGNWSQLVHSNQHHRQAYYIAYCRDNLHRATERATYDAPRLSKNEKRLAARRQYLASRYQKDTIVLVCVVLSYSTAWLARKILPCRLANAGLWTFQHLNLVGLFMSSYIVQRSRSASLSALDRTL